MAFHIRNCVGTRDDRSFAVQWLACALPCRRFADALADVCARLRADVGRYSFTVRDLHPLLLAGLPAHSENLHNNGSSQHPPRLGYHGQFRLSSRSGRRFGLRLFQKSQKSLTGFCAQFLGIQRPIMIWICRSETLLDDREILVLRERSIVVRIGIGELFRSQSAARSLTTSCVRLELRSLPSPELPGFSGTTNPSASPGRPACPSRASGWSSLPTPWVSRVAYAFLVYMLSPLPRCSGWAYCFAHSPQPYQPSPKGLSGRPAHRPFRDAMGRR